MVENQELDISFTELRWLSARRKQVWKSFWNWFELWLVHGSENNQTWDFQGAAKWNLKSEKLPSFFQKQR